MEDLQDMPRLRWGILGTGRMARAFATDLVHLPGAELVAVGSRTMDGAERFAAEFGVPRPLGSYAALAECAGVDIVYVATPHSSHCELVLQCVGAGKHVLCEKPFALSGAQARRMIEAARARGVFLMEAMWTRFVPAVAQLRELVRAGAIGDVQMLLAGGAFIPEQRPDFYLFRRDLGGGALLDAGVYLVSMSSMLLGPPARIAVLGELSRQGIDDHEGILMSHAGGALAILHLSLRTRAAPDMTLLGSTGKIHVAAPVFCPRRLTISRPGREDEALEFPFSGTGYRFQAREAARCIGAGLGDCPVMPLDESLRILETMDSIRAQLGVVYPGE
jgi:predicted dehydrogenase